MPIFTPSGFISLSPVEVARHPMNFGIPQVARMFMGSTPLEIELIEPGMANGMTVHYGRT